LKYVKIISKVRLVVLVCATALYVLALFTNSVHQDTLINIVLAMLALHFALEAIEIYIKGRLIHE